MDWGNFVRKSIVLSIFLSSMLAFAIVIIGFTESMIPHPRYGEYEVIRVDDASNILVQKTGAEQRMFLIGVDPSEHSEISTKFVRDLIAGEPVTVEYDRFRNKANTHGIVEYCYMYLKDGRMLNALVISEGLADYTPDMNKRYDKQFKELRDIAKKNKKGIWSKGENE